MKLLFTTGAFLLFISSHSQIVDNTEQKAKETTDQHIDRTSAEGIDNELVAFEMNFKQDSPIESGEDSEHNIVVAKNYERPDIFITSDADIVSVEDEYHFEHNVVIRSTMFDKKRKRVTCSTNLYVLF